VLISTAEDLPVAATVCGANRQDATFVTPALLSLPIHPPIMQELAALQIEAGRRSNGKQSTTQLQKLGEQLQSSPDVRAMPYLRGDGNFAKITARCCAKQQGFRLWAPRNGQSRRGLGRVRSSVERTHALLNQFGRVCRRFDRRVNRYAGWIALASSLIFMRQGFFP
jgi:hypothetical protein